MVGPFEALPVSPDAKALINLFHPEGSFLRSRSWGSSFSLSYLTIMIMCRSVKMGDHEHEL